MIYYAVDNFLAGSDVVISSSSEDPLYVLDYLHNERPSKPFRFTGHGSAGNPEWVCVEFDAPKRVTLAALFNHNLTALAGANDALVLKGCDDPCAGSGGCDWSLPDYSHSIKDRLVDGWNDLFHFIDETRLAYRLEVIDETNVHAIELGEYFLGQKTALFTARLLPGRSESPQLHRFMNVTPYGQHWAASLADSVTLELVASNLNDPHQVDAVRRMILAVHANNGRFIIVPNPAYPFVYYVFLENDNGFMAQVVRGLDRELTDWTFSLRTLAKGIMLL
jgi:hypothetical protein